MEPMPCNNPVYADYTEHFTTNKIFYSRQELLDWARIIGRELGYVIVIGSSNKGKTGRKPSLHMQCERSGPYRSMKPSSKSTGTRKIYCPFSLKGIKMPNEDEWMVRVDCGFHNHPAVQYMEGHSYAARLSKDENDIVFNLSKNLVKPRKILATIKTRDPSNVSNIKTIYNARQKQQASERDGRNNMQQLLFLLDNGDYFTDHRSDNITNELQDLFFAHPRSLDLLRAFPYILLMDTTYKTNRFNLPFLQIVGVTSTEMTFCVAFVFLQFEKEDNFTWALKCLCRAMKGCSFPRVILTDRDLALMNAVNFVFPKATHLLCRWHISRDVAKNCKKHFPDKKTWDTFYSMWHSLVESETPGDFDIRLSGIENTFFGYQNVLNYINKVWLEKYKEKFVSCWTNESMHYGNRTTNRAESQHAMLKKYLENSKGNLESVWKQVEKILEAQATSIKVSLEKSINYMKHDFSSPVFSELRGFVSFAGLGHILKEVNRYNDGRYDPYNCFCTVQINHGLPCVHEIGNYVFEGRPIPLSAIDIFWRKLDFKPTSRGDDDDLICDAEIEQIKTQLKKKPRWYQFQVLQKLRELINPALTRLTDPKVKNDGRRGHGGKKKMEAKATRGKAPASQYSNVNVNQAFPGRHSYSAYYDATMPVDSDIGTTTRQRSLRKQNTDTSRRRNSSVAAFSYIDTNENVIAPNTDSYSHPYFQPPEEMDTPNAFDARSYIDQFPSYMHPYIISITDVMADGNCGFRSVALALQLPGGEEAWPQVRNDLINELQNNVDEYAVLFGGYEKVSYVLTALNFFERGRFAPSMHWMSFPDMGHMIASTYNVALVLLSQTSPQTYLPLRTGPRAAHEQRIISIGHVNQNHFVQISLVPNPPMPPIMVLWATHRHGDARLWGSIYDDNFRWFVEMQMWNPVSVPRPCNVRHPTINCDSD